MWPVLAASGPLSFFISPDAGGLLQPLVTAILTSLATHTSLTGMRERLRFAFDRVVAPLTDGLVSLGVSANAITTLGTLVLGGAGVAYAMGAVPVGGGLLILSGALDMLDGALARRNRLSMGF